MGDIYKRQKELRLWNQDVLTEKHALILGVGGLGTNIAMDCLRLGLREITIVDFDVVEEHNLNRQILFSAESVGKPKVEEAKKTLEAMHKTRDSQVVNAHSMNVLDSWDKVVKMVEQCDIVYNTVDFGDYFHAAICSAARLLNKPAVTGGTEPYYGHTVVVFFQDPEGCPYHAAHELPDKAIVKRIVEPSLLKETKLDFLPADEMLPTGGSTVYTAGTCSHIMFSLIINYLQHKANPERPKPPTKTVFNMMAFDVETWHLDKKGDLEPQ